MRLTVTEFNDKLFHSNEGDTDNDVIFEFECAHCGSTLWTDREEDLLPPCHPDEDHFIEGSGYWGHYYVYCASNNPKYPAYCGWGGPIENYQRFVVCGKCHAKPFLPEQE